MSDPNIPIVPNSFTPDQNLFAQAVKACLEILMGQGRNLDKNRALRVYEYDAGIATIQEQIPEPQEGESLDTPEPPTNLQVIKGLWSHHLTWDNPIDEIVSHIEIWVAVDSQNRSNARLRGVVTVTDNLRGEGGNFDYSDLSVTSDLTYWIRSVSYAGNHSTWEPPDDQGGYVVPGSETIQETIDKIMDALHGSITENELYQDLNTRIDLIDNPGTGLIDRVGDNSAAIQSEETARTTADSALAQQITTLFTKTGDNAAAIQSEKTARTMADSALAQQINTVQSTVGNHTTSIQTNATSIDGVKGKYSVKIDNNGYITGYGLLSTNNNSTPTSEFIMQVDKFKIVSPGITPQIPFAVGRVDGTWTVGINGNLVVDGTILADKLHVDAIIGKRFKFDSSSSESAAYRVYTGPTSMGAWGDRYAHFSMVNSSSELSLAVHKSNAGDGSAIYGYCSSANQAGAAVAGYNNSYKLNSYGGFFLANQGNGINCGTNNPNAYGLFTGQRISASNFVPFTGTHIVYTNDFSFEAGEIVYAEESWCYEINQAMTLVKKTASPFNKKVMGVVSSGLIPIMTDILTNVHLSEQLPGNDARTVKPEYQHYIEGLVAGGYRQVFVNALGEGGVLVCSDNGDIENGDYLCSGTTPGHAMKQDDDILHSYTVAKSLENVTWANEPETTKLISCTYHCG